jgi:phosphoglycolate phosphatase
VSLELPKAIVFDWDNTLVDSWPVIMQAINKARVQFGLPAWSYEEILKYCTRAARDSFPEWFGSKWKEAYEFYYKSFDELRKSASISVKPGAKELLDWLKQKNIPCYVVSNKRGDYLRLEAERLGWNEHFIAVIGAGDALRDKPAREHVDHALKHGNHEAHASIWFVGDSDADIQCAFNSGCTPVLIGTPEFARELGVELVFPDCKALQTLLYNLSK